MFHHLFIPTEVDEEKRLIYTYDVMNNVFVDFGHCSLHLQQLFQAAAQRLSQQTESINLTLKTEGFSELAELFQLISRLFSEYFANTRLELIAVKHPRVCGVVNRYALVEWRERVNYIVQLVRALIELIRSHLSHQNQNLYIPLQNVREILHDFEAIGRQIRLIERIFSSTSERGSPPKQLADKHVILIVEVEV